MDLVFTAFTALPVCAGTTITYLYSVTPTAALVSFVPSTRTFTFYEATDLTQTSTTGPNYYKDYTVTITALAGSMLETADFSLRVKNPCVDSALSQISGPVDQTI